jgi:hypothetical protein
LPDEGNDSFILKICFVYSMKMDLKKKKREREKSRKQDESPELISLARKRLQQSQHEFDKIASAWAVELQKMEPQQQLFAKKAINNILFEGQLGSLRRDSVQINNSSRSTSPYCSMQASPINYLCDSHVHYKNNLNTLHKYSSLVLLSIFQTVSK